jgi:D-arabinose 1-dehydrogenase-like Zn-dependent alcohol dehydrogenase
LPVRRAQSILDIGETERKRTAMRAVRLASWNHDPELHEVPEPDPGPGEVVLAIGGAGACHSDLHVVP